MKEIKLTQGKVALVDDEDDPVLSRLRWYSRNRGNNWYVISHPCYKGYPIQMHSLLINCPLGSHTDHKDCNGLNNQKSNLRIVSNQQNQWNGRRHKNCKSKYKGVHWHSARRKWQIDCGGRYFGLYTDEEEAARLYNEIARDMYGEYARLNEV